MSSVLTQRNKAQYSYYLSLSAATLYLDSHRMKSSFNAFDTFHNTSLSYMTATPEHFLQH